MAQVYMSYNELCKTFDKTHKNLFPLEQLKKVMAILKGEGTEGNNEA